MSRIAVFVFIAVPFMLIATFAESSTPTLLQSENQTIKCVPHYSIPQTNSQQLETSKTDLTSNTSSIPSPTGHSATEIYLSLGVLLFGIVILVLEVFVLLRQKQGWGVNSTRIVGLTLVVIAGVFLITAGYSESQIAPMIGLLGTIVGYLLGKSDSSPK